MNILRRIIGAFAHYNCVSCEEDVGFKFAVCNSCFFHIEPVNQEFACKKCGRFCKKDLCFFCHKSMPKFTQGKFYCSYGEVSAALIKNYKYYNNQLCKHFIAKHVGNVYKNQMQHLKIDCIVPVPMNEFKEWIKGFNHTSQIAKSAFTQFNIEILPFALKKKFLLKKQVGSLKAERLTNMKGAFYINKGYSFAGKNVLLFDDVITTGATILECTKVLLENGAKNVFVLTFAKSLADEEMLKNAQEEMV